MTAKKKAIPEVGSNATETTIYDYIADHVIAWHRIRSNLSPHKNTWGAAWELKLLLRAPPWL